MSIMSTCQRIAILECSSGIHLEAYDSRAALLLDQLGRCDLTELARLRTEVIPGLEAAELARLETETDALDCDEEDNDDV